MSAIAANVPAASATVQRSTADPATVEIEHGQLLWSSHSSPVSGPNVSSRYLDVVGVDEPFEFGGDIGRSLQIVDAETGRSIIFEPDADTETYTIDRIVVPTRPSTDLRSSVRVEPADAEIGDTTDVSGTYRGDRDLFERRTFSPYVVELLNEDGRVIGTTDVKVIGTNYEWVFEQDETTATITCDETVDEDWYVTVTADEFPESDTMTIANDDGDDVFKVPLGEFDVPAGEYAWDLDIYENADAADDDDPIIRISTTDSPDTMLVIGDNDDGGDGDENGAETEAVADSDADNRDKNDGSEDTTESAPSADGSPGFGLGAAFVSLAGAGYTLSRNHDGR